MNLSKEFARVRNIPLRIPFDRQELDHSPIGKHRELQRVLAQHGYESMLVPALIRWNELPLPAHLRQGLAPIESWHALLAVQYNDTTRLVDISWHAALCPPFRLRTWNDVLENQGIDTWIEVRDPRQDGIATHGADLYADQHAFRPFFVALNRWMEHPTSPISSTRKANRRDNVAIDQVCL